MAKLTFSGPTRETDAQAAKAAAILAGDPTHIHVLPAENIIIVYTGVDVISFDPRPTVTKWQFIQACANAGITEAQIDTAVALLTNKRQRFWKYIQILDRDNPMSGLLRQAILPTPPTVNQWNAIFVAAAGLDPLQV